MHDWNSQLPPSSLLILGGHLVFRGGGLDVYRRAIRTELHIRFTDAVRLEVANGLSGGQPNAREENRQKRKRTMVSHASHFKTLFAPMQDNS